MGLPLIAPAGAALFKIGSGLAAGAAKIGAGLAAGAGVTTAGLAGLSAAFPNAMGVSPEKLGEDDPTQFDRKKGEYKSDTADFMKRQFAAGFNQDKVAENYAKERAFAKTKSDEITEAEAKKDIKEAGIDLIRTKRMAGQLVPLNDSTANLKDLVKLGDNETAEEYVDRIGYLTPQIEQLTKAKSLQEQLTPDQLESLKAQNLDVGNLEFGSSGVSAAVTTMTAHRYRQRRKRHQKRNRNSDATKRRSNS